MTPEETKTEVVIPNVHSILYWVDKNNILGPAPTNPSDDSQFNHWEIPVQNWWAKNSGKYGVTTWADKPMTLDDVHTGIYTPIISITEPDTTSIYSKYQKIQLGIENTGSYPLQKIDVFVNDVFLDTVMPPFNFSFIPEELDNLKAENELKIISYDTAYNRGETSIIFKVNNN